MAAARSHQALGSLAPLPPVRPHTRAGGAAALRRTFWGGEAAPPRRDPAVGARPLGRGSTRWRGGREAPLPGTPPCSSPLPPGRPPPAGAQPSPGGRSPQAAPARPRAPARTPRRSLRSAPRRRHAPFSASSRRAGHGRRSSCAGGDPHGLRAASNGTPRRASPPGLAPPGPARPPPCGAGARRPRPGKAEPGGPCGAAREGRGLGGCGGCGALPSVQEPWASSAHKVVPRQPRSQKLMRGSLSLGFLVLDKSII